MWMPAAMATGTVSVTGTRLSVEGPSRYSPDVQDSVGQRYYL